MSSGKIISHIMRYYFLIFLNHKVDIQNKILHTKREHWIAGVYILFNYFIQLTCVHYSFELNSGVLD